MGAKNAGGRAVSIPKGLMWGAGVSIAATVLISFLGAQLFMSEMIAQEQIGYCCIAALLAGSILGAYTASGKVKHKKLLVCLLNGCVYFVILLATTALFFDGQYYGFGVTFITVLLGSFAAALLANHTGNKGPKH